jgi:hypothetical protein
MAEIILPDAVDLPTMRIVIAWEMVKTAFEYDPPLNKSDPAGRLNRMIEAYPKAFQAIVKAEEDYS